MDEKGIESTSNVGGRGGGGGEGSWEGNCIVKVVFESVLITKYLFVDNFDMPGAALSILYFSKSLC